MVSSLQVSDFNSVKDFFSLPRVLLARHYMLHKTESDVNTETKHTASQGRDLFQRLAAKNLTAFYIIRSFIAVGTKAHN
jgi:hypothetical protein